METKTIKKLVGVQITLDEKDVDTVKGIIKHLNYLSSKSDDRELVNAKYFLKELIGDKPEAVPVEFKKETKEPQERSNKDVKFTVTMELSTGDMTIAELTAIDSIINNENNNQRYDNLYDDINKSGGIIGTFDKDKANLLKNVLNNLGRKVYLTQVA